MRDLLGVDDPALLLRTAIGIVVLVAAAMGLLRLGGVRLGAQPVIAVGRAILQLGLASVILSGALTLPWTVVAVLAFMLTMASATSAGRLAALDGGRSAAALAVVAGAVISVGAVFALGMMPHTARDVIAIGGIVTGNAMTAATLSGRQFRTLASHRSGEVEAWWALGATSPIAFADVGRHAVRDALVPNLDQTRSSGVVTLPGAFIGALAGGASPVEAARFQVVVLVAILFAQVISALVVTRRLARSGRLPLAEDD